MTEYKGIHGEPLEPSRGSHTQGGNEEKSIDERDHTRLRYLPRVDRFSVRDKIRLGTYTNKEPWPAANMEAKVKWKKRADQLEGLFIIDALMETRLHSHPRAMLAMDLAKMDHPGMFLEMLKRLEMIAVIVGVKEQ